MTKKPRGRGHHSGTRETKEKKNNAVRAITILDKTKKGEGEGKNDSKRKNAVTDMEGAGRQRSPRSKNIGGGGGSVTKKNEKGKMRKGSVKKQKKKADLTGVEGGEQEVRKGNDPCLIWWGAL